LLNKLGINAKNSDLLNKLGKNAENSDLLNINHLQISSRVASLSGSVGRGG
jgi:hypothetical protein